MGDREAAAGPGSPAETESSTQVAPGVATEARAERASRRLRDVISEQLGLRGVVHEYMIPVDTNTIWYSLGGVLAISLLLEIVSGFFLALRYNPDAGTAFGTTSLLLHESGWSVALNFHYWNSYVIFALVMIHMVRVFLSAGYRLAKKGLWQVGVALAGVVFLLSLTGETLHWDERGFAVPWHVAEFFEAVHLDETFNYGRPDLLTVPSATRHLIPYYALHVAILPIALLGLIAMHYYLIKIKHISLPFWHKPTGREAPFSEHVKAWFRYAAVILGPIVLLSIFMDRDPGPAPQLLESSPFFGSEHGPGGLGIVPTFPISWTHGMNRFVVIAFNLEPDIWGTVIGMGLMTAALVAIPYLDRGTLEPTSWGEALNLRERGWAFAAMILFWAVMIIGVLTNIITPKG
jgi:quinol-cytochrome oxidoreductase complex cytochrome b subunit